MIRSITISNNCERCSTLTKPPISASNRHNCSRDYLSRGHDFLEQNRETSSSPPTLEVTPGVSNKVFVVHGHDDAAKNEVALFLRGIGLEPIILHLRPNGGRGLLTKFREDPSGARFAVVLMTPDDEGGPVGVIERKARARQNVVFELGFFIGQLGPAKVAALIKDDVESPSETSTVLPYTKFDLRVVDGRAELARELLHAKLPFDAAKALTA